MEILLGASAFFLVLFIVLYARNKARLSTGFVFLCLLASLGGVLLLYAAGNEAVFLQVILMLLGFAVAFVLLFGIYIFAFFLLLNTRVVFRRERRSFANSLTLVLGLFLLGLMVGTHFIRGAESLLLRRVWAGGFTVVVAYLFMLATFLVSLLLANLARPPGRQQYIIVLGSGLINGEVPPLLARRIDRAVRFYHRQAKRRAPPKLVMSGGQGPDEPRPEATAMGEYAQRKGIPPEHILLEESSTTTEENLRFSKQLMDFDARNAPYRCIYATNNYHLLRAGMLARGQGLDIDGIGCRTALYYLPNALLREFAAIIWLYKGRFAALAAASFLFGAFAFSGYL